MFLKYENSPVKYLQKMTHSFLPVDKHNHVFGADTKGDSFYIYTKEDELQFCFARTNLDFRLQENWCFVYVMSVSNHS